MELLPTVPTIVGMVYCSHYRSRPMFFDWTTTPEGWRYMKSSKEDRKLITAVNLVLKQLGVDNTARFLVQREWGEVPQLLIKALDNKTLPRDKGYLSRQISINMIAIKTPIEFDYLKSILAAYRRLDIEQVVCCVLRLLPEHVHEFSSSRSHHYNCGSHVG